MLVRNDFTRQKGAFEVVARNSFIFLNGNISDEMQKMVCAHEFGHSQLYRELGMCPEGLLEFGLFRIMNQREYDANTFADTLPLSDEEVIEYAKAGYDAMQIAGMMNVNVNMLLLKLNEKYSCVKLIREEYWRIR